MATPKKKTSKSRRDMRRSHDALGTNSYMECPKCGQYDSREVVAQKATNE